MSIVENDAPNPKTRTPLPSLGHQTVFPNLAASIRTIAALASTTAASVAVASVNSVIFTIASVKQMALHKQNKTIIRKIVMFLQKKKLYIYKIAQLC